MQSDFVHQLCGPIETPRLLLLSRMGTHADASFGPLQDKAIYQWISLNKPSDLDAMRAHWTRIGSRLSTDGTEAWPVWANTTRANGTLIGQDATTVLYERASTIAKNFDLRNLPPRLLRESLAGL